MESGERPRGGRERRLNRVDDGLRLAHAAGPVLAAGHVSLFGADEERAIRSQLRGVALRRGMKPHAQIHRRREQHPLVGRKQQRRRQIIGDSIRRLCQEIGCRRRDDDEIGVAREADVPHFAFERRVEEVGVDGRAGKGGERKLGDEFPARRRQDDARRSARLAQPANELERLIRRDPASHDEQNPFTREFLRRLENRHPVLPSRSSRLCARIQTFPAPPSCAATRLERFIARFAAPSQPSPLRGRGS